MTAQMGSHVRDCHFTSALSDMFLHTLLTINRFQHLYTAIIYLPTDVRYTEN